MAQKSRLFKLEALMGGGGEPAVRSLASRSPRSFANGAVGLGIVAAMSGGEVAWPMAARSEPIPIVSGARARARPVLVDEDEEKSESYTCVISHVGGNMARKRVYFDDGSECDGTFSNCDSITGFFFESLPPAPPPAMDFMSCCYLCRKKLRGLDIFMYRGDKAFCSVECRC